MTRDAQNPVQRADAYLREVAENYSDGSTTLARHAVLLLKCYARDLHDEDATSTHDHLIAFAERLAAARPAMVAIAAAVEAWRAAFGNVLAASTPGEAATHAGSDVLDRMSRASAVTARKGADALHGHDVILTHSASSAVVAAFRRLPAERFRVIATESMPGGEGVTLAGQLDDSGIATKVIADVDAPAAVREADAFAVGADAILPDGSVVNKVGTRTIAEAAHKAGTPVIVIAESFKSSRAMVPLETSPDGTGPLFDVTPPEMVSLRAGDAEFPL